MQEICDLLRKETLEPAKQEAEEIVENAHAEAKKIVEEAKKEAEKLEKQEEKKREQREKSFQASLSLAARQAVADLKQTIERKLFKESLKDSLSAAIQEKGVLVSMIKTLLKIVEKEGLEGDFSLVLPEKEKLSLVQELAKEGLSRWEKNLLFVEGMQGGVKLKLEKKQVTLDMSEEALVDLLGKYLRSDFKAFLFNSNKNV